MPSYIERGGKSFREAVVIVGATGSDDGVSAEYHWLEKKLGVREGDWKVEIQELAHRGDRWFDILRVRLADGTRRAYYFDITGFFGRM